MKPNTSQTKAKLTRAAKAAGVDLPKPAGQMTTAELADLRRRIVAAMWDAGHKVPEISAAIGRAHPQGAAPILTDAIARGMTTRRKDAGR